MLPHWSQNEILVNGACIHYYRTGSPAAPHKPALVLAHIPGVGHHVRFENHTLSMEAVLEFLKEL